MRAGDCRKDALDAWLDQALSKSPCQIPSICGSVQRARILTMRARLFVTHPAWYNMATTRRSRETK